MGACLGNFDTSQKSSIFKGNEHEKAVLLVWPGDDKGFLIESPTCLSRADKSYLFRARIRNSDLIRLSNELN